ncbi:protein of unknown function DUF1611 [[Leptolyngbya] sp. PCC 7376]|uniref:DUF1611 domain-containing protein n=1 Tax=[Leptolyngbya] sp. PCC 7376 TaxID=111781 RepID=UPI00029F3DE8|nr:DUF1611 domain-containing protein [[Leptolyngbya] sp. PCC 7376]AFY39565.1 protein of unknown function DUF1611 [[Leptolyngbya] sp. PCC 7376]
MTITKKTALIYCQDQFGLVDGKTAAALVRHSELYTIVGVIDSLSAGNDAGEILGEAISDIPIFSDFQDALAHLSETPHCYIYGKAPLDVCIPSDERLLILEAMEHGMNIINGLHEFFSEDQEFVAAAVQNNVQIKDIRKSPNVKDLHVFSGRIYEITVPVIAILGTDCACGKMTTAVELNNALNRLGIKSVFVATGQTSLMQGAIYGASIDALISQFVIGEIENAVIQAFEQEKPDIILVEGQSAVSHPAFMSSLGILKGSMPDGIILQHPPAREFRCDFPALLMPTIESEIQLIETISSARVLAIALSHENLAIEEILSTIQQYETQLNLPTTDVLSYGCKKLIQALAVHFPKLSQKIKPENFPETRVLAKA